MTYELKPVSFADRVKCSDMAKTDIIIDRNTKPDLSNARMQIHNPLETSVAWCRAGLKSLNDVEITPENFDEELNKLSDAEIAEIGREIREKAQSGKKK